MGEKNKPKRRFSRTGLILTGCTLVCFILFLAVGMPNGFLGGGGQGGDLDDDGTPGIKDVVSGSTPILIFDKSAKAKALMKAFDEGEISKVDILYDQGGGNSSIESEDQAVIKKAYKALKNVVVLKPSMMSVTDSYHHIVFTLSDGTEVGYSFEGTGILVYSNSDSSEDNGNYSVEGSEGIWALYENLREAAGEQ